MGARDFFASLDSQLTAQSFKAGSGGAASSQRAPPAPRRALSKSAPTTPLSGNKDHELEVSEAKEKEETSRILEELLAEHLAKEAEATSLDRSGISLPLHGSPSASYAQELGWDPSQPRGGGGVSYGGSLGGRLGGSGLGKTNGIGRRIPSDPLTKAHGLSPGRFGELGPNSDPRLLWEALGNLRYAKEQLEMDYEAMEAQLVHQQQMSELMKKEIDQMVAAGAQDPFLAQLPPIRSPALRAEVQRMTVQYREAVVDISNQDSQTMGGMPGGGLGHRYSDNPYGSSLQNPLPYRRSPPKAAFFDQPRFPRRTAQNDHELF